MTIAPGMPSITMNGSPHFLILMGEQAYRDMTQWAWRAAIERARKQLANIEYWT